jgi:hypothetical protein
MACILMGLARTLDQAMNEWRWDRGMPEEAAGMSREQRESAACARRLEQMAKNREKQAKREANRLSAAPASATLPPVKP